MLKTVLLFLLLGLTSPLNAHAHGPSGSIEEYQALFEKLFNSIHQVQATNDAGKMPYVYFGKKNNCAAGECSYFNGDVFTRIIQQTLNDVEPDAGTVSPEVIAEIKNKRFKILQTVQHYLEGLAKFGLEIPATLIEGYPQYGVSYVVYTALTEFVEHVGLGIAAPIFCKLLQAAYFVTAGTVIDYQNMYAITKNWDRSRWYRMQTAYRAVSNKLRFRYRTGKSTFVQNPGLSSNTQANFDHYIDALPENEKSFTHEYIAESIFWGDLMTNVYQQNNIAVSGEHYTLNSFAAEVSNIASIESADTRLWKVFRVTSFFNLIKEVISEGSATYTLDKAKWVYTLPDALSFSRVYITFIANRYVLGEFGRLVQDYRNQLYMEALNPNEDLRTKQFEKLARFTEEYLLPVTLSAQSLMTLEGKREVGLSNLRKQVKNAKTELNKLLPKKCARILQTQKDQSG